MKNSSGMAGSGDRLERGGEEFALCLEILGVLEMGGGVGDLLGGSQRETESAREGCMQTCDCEVPEVEDHCRGVGPEQGKGSG